MVEIRTLTEADVVEYQTHVESVFGGDYDEQEAAAWRPLIELDRNHAAVDDGRIVGSAGVFTFDMTAPGGPVPTAGVTVVGVAATHRRQGILTRLMRTQLDAIRERDAEPVAALWASEAVIYGRFGYGVAARRLNVTLDAREPELLGAPPRGRVRVVDDLADIAPPLYDAVRAARPGMISRDERRWPARLCDLPQHRHGAGQQRNVVYEVDGAVRGYAMYRLKPSWDPGPRGEVRVKELVHLDADAHAGLWRYLTSIDLMPLTTYDNVPPDDALFHRLRDPRLVRVNGFVDGVHVRVLDVARAFEARSYDGSARLVVDVVDGFGGYASGRWALDVSPDGVSCAPTDAFADVTMGAAELGALYLGDTTLRELHLAGRVDEHTPDAVEKASPALAWPVRAWCPEIF
ncbi:MAG TPA: GNAT family N-acetyltransferase [Frankiaceae bacterium]|jgi:predicted acetyltransferase|nr:GNAT family N-acetyltransferase [Frankiaceae bacterium]